MVKQGVWVAWENHRRSKTLSAALGIPLVQFDYKLPRILRYALLPWLTLYVFLRRQPKVIFVQNPSLVLALVATTYGRLLSLPVIVDAHNAGLLPLEGNNRILNRVARYLMRSASITIVTNAGLAALVSGAGGTPFILPDPLPSFDMRIQSASRSSDTPPLVLFISTWARDEPYEQVLQAANLLDTPISLQITGNYKRASTKLLSQLPKNVQLLGHVSESHFIQLLLQSDIIIDLTTRENCLLCGAYEAVAVEKPLVTSDTTALRTLFHKGTIYTRPEPTNIANAIKSALENREMLVRESSELKNEMIDTFNKKKKTLLNQIHVLCSSQHQRS